MAVGDIINGKLANSNNWAYFQPSSGTEIIITGVFAGDGTVQLFGMYDGTDLGYGRIGYSGNFSINGMQKIGITNTNYLSTYSVNTHSYYSGIQIK